MDSYDDYKTRSDRDATDEPWTPRTVTVHCITCGCLVDVDPDDRGAYRCHGCVLNARERAIDGARRRV